ncbi:MAG: KUP/HAK/KT family potassium transporter, partial [Ignavibacteriaceae bacterium]
ALKKALRDLDFETFLHSYKQVYNKENCITGTALFLVHNIKSVPPYIGHCILKENIIYEKNIFVSISTTENPFGINYKVIDDLGPGLSAIKIYSGYMEYFQLPNIIKELEIKEKVIFYGDEEILTRKPLYKIFSFMKKISPRFVKFYDFPYNKLHGVVSRFEI